MSNKISLQDLLKRKKIREEIRALEEESKIALSKRRDYDTEQIAKDAPLTIIDPESLKSELVTHLIARIIDWIYQNISGSRLVIRDLFDDLHDGYILLKLAMALSTIDSNNPMEPETDISMSQTNKMARLTKAFDIFERSSLNLPDYITPEAVLNKNNFAILILMVEIITNFDNDYELPVNVPINLKKINSDLTVSNKEFQINSSDQDQTNKSLAATDYLPENHEIIKLLLSFAQGQLVKLNIEINRLDQDFKTGANLIILLGILKGFFVPIYLWYPKPENLEQCQQNVRLFFELMKEMKIACSSESVSEVITGNSSTTKRILYALYQDSCNVLNSSYANVCAS